MLSHFKFNKQQRSGIFFLLFFILILQIAYLSYDAIFKNKTNSSFRLDSLNQARIDSLKAVENTEYSKTYPFNPNYISDYKGYTLGLSVEQIDRLHQFRAKGEFVNSALEFQKVTKVSDSLLAILEPSFKFPDWVNSKPNKTFHKRSNSGNLEIKDLNTVSKEELVQIKGIGEVLSTRIIKFRTKLGGFLIEEQLNDVYGLTPEVVKEIQRNYKILNVPDIKKFNLNTATVNQLSSIVYINRQIAEKIVSKRLALGLYKSIDELKEIPNFPADKIDRIALYLSI
ncbi:ComEA family DNA-binding protein [Croceivirga lutea]|uniref:ComEA family DNA-binding protein n=1 Tax=Croceivirga lutea TaxID=1775167 RepID=UPI001F5130ED|nr:helix-hairpin-helix domain-containing protein [Croceivirga lutea]